jgi:hypothetical protein
MVERPNAISLRSSLQPDQIEYDQHCPMPIPSVEKLVPQGGTEAETPMNFCPTSSGMTGVGEPLGVRMRRPWLNQEEDVTTGQLVYHCVVGEGGGGGARQEAGDIGAFNKCLRQQQ